MSCNSVHIGQIIRTRRKEMNLTIEQVSELCDMSVKGYEKVELGDSDPRWSTIIRIFVALDMDLYQISDRIWTKHDKEINEFAREVINKKIR